MNPEVLYEELNRQVREGTQALINAAAEKPDYWWTVDALAQKLDPSYSKAALGLAMDRLLLDEVFELKSDILAGRRMKLRRVYTDGILP